MTIEIQSSAKTLTSKNTRPGLFQPGLFVLIYRSKFLLRRARFVELSFIPAMYTKERGAWLKDIASTEEGLEAPYGVIELGQ